VVISKNIWFVFFQFVLLLAFTHSVLRVSPESSISLYRVFAPITLFILALSYRRAMFPLIITALISLNSLVLTFLYCQCFKHYAVFVIHLLLLLNIYLIVSYLKDKVGFYGVYKYFLMFFISSLILAYTELFFHFNLPNVAVYTDGSVSAFNWNQNELSSALISFLPLLLVFIDSKLLKYSLVSTLLFLFYVNDAKVALIALLAGVFIYLFKIHFLRFRGFVNVFIFLLFILIGIIVFLSYYQESGVLISFRDYQMSLSELIYIPILSILNLVPLDDFGGSIDTRVNAIIYALIEFKKSYFLGIGIGNTLTMLETPEYFLKSAKSLHNFPMQILVENGFWIIIIYLGMFVYFVKLLFCKLQDKYQLLHLVAIPTLLLGLVGSSVGIFSNYFVWASMFLICLTSGDRVNDK